MLETHTVTDSEHMLRTCLVDKQRRHKFSWLEHIHHLPDEVVIGGLGEIGFKADVGELWLRGDVDGPVSSLLGDEQTHSSKERHRPDMKLGTEWALTSVFIPFIEYPQGLNIVASITEPGIRSRIPLICKFKKKGCF